MLFIVFLSFTQSSIPYQYRDLINEALKSAEIKTPKGQREDTKYPGVYEGAKYHFKLIKTLTNKHTNDVKGFSYNKKNCAIVKRKKFNLTDGFTVVDPQTQNIYLLTKRVFQEDKVLVYESQKVNIFSIMTDFVMETSTDQNINDLPIRSTRRRSKRPKAEIKFGYNWNDNTDRPNLQPLQENLDAGVGYSIKIGVSTKLSFKSIWDISISFRLIFEGKFGVEVLIPDDSEIEIPEVTLLERKIAIPSLGFSASFLGLEISIGAFMNFVIEIIDIKVTIPLGFDYFKGYKITTSKYFEITPTSITDSKWETTITNLPEVDSTKEVFKRVLQATFSATVQVRPYISLEFNLGSLATSLECGLKFPVMFDFTFNKELCTFPHLHADVSMPIKMYFAFAGLDFESYTLIDRAEKEILLVNIDLPSFCIGNKRMITDDEGSYDPGTAALYVTMDDAYDERPENPYPFEKEVSFKFLDKDNNTLSQKRIPLQYYDTVEKKQHDRFMISLNSEAASIEWSLSFVDYYYDYENYFYYYYELVKSDDTFVKQISDIKFENETNKLSYQMGLRLDKNDDSDILRMTANIEQIPVVFIDEVYKRKTEWTLLYFYEASIVDYSLFCIDEEGNRYVDHSATFLSYYADTEDLKKTGDTYVNDLNDFVFKINSSTILKDNVKVRMEIYRIYEQNGEEKVHPIAIILTPTLNTGDDFAQMPEGQEAYSLYIEDGFQFTISLYLFEDGYMYDYGTYMFPNPREYSLQNYTIYINEYIWFDLQFYLGATNVLVKSSHEEPYSAYETIVGMVEVTQLYLIENISDAAFRFFTIFNAGESYKILQFKYIPEEFRNESIFIIFDSVDYLIDFMDERVTKLGSGVGIIHINGSETLEIPIIRERYDNIFVNGTYYYVTFPSTGMIVVPDGTSIFAKYNLPTFLLVPNFYSIDTFAYYMPPGNQVMYSIHHDNNYTMYVFKGMHKEGDQFTLFLNSTGLGEEEPSVEANLTNLQNYIDTFGELTYSVFSNNGIKIRAEMDGKSEIVDLVGNRATFSFKGKIGDIVFTSICANETEKVCEIKYPEPNQTGYHYIKYPNRWGISTTGRGFLAEIIPVEKGKSFYYYKTYTGSIELVKEYSSETVDVTIKIIDERNANYENMKRTRTICLIDEDGLVVPFSRQFVNDDLFRFLEMIGISKDIDMNYLYNDEEGKIIFDPQYISSNDFSNVSSYVCDLNISGATIKNVDKSDLIFDVGGIDKSQRRKTIMILIIAIVIIIVLLALFILFIVLKIRKCIRLRVENKYVSSDEDDVFSIYEKEPEKMVVDAFDHIENNVFENIGKNGHEEIILDAFGDIEMNVFENFGINSHEKMIVDAFGKVETRLVDNIAIYNHGQMVVDAFENVENDVFENIGIQGSENKGKSIIDNMQENVSKNIAKNASQNNQTKNTEKDKPENIEKDEHVNPEKDEYVNPEMEDSENIEKNEYVNPENDDSENIEKNENVNQENDDSVNIEKDESENASEDESVNIEKDESENAKEDESVNTEKDESAKINDDESENSGKYDDVI